MTSPTADKTEVYLHLAKGTALVLKSSYHKRKKVGGGSQQDWHMHALSASQVHPISKRVELCSANTHSFVYATHVSIKWFHNKQIDKSCFTSPK